MLSRITISTLAVAAALSLAAPASAAVIVITQAKANAGNVTPGDTAGFPVTLSVPGAYRLDTNLTVPAGKNGIHVTSAYVDIDMNGFRLWGWNAAGTTRLANNGVYSGFGISSIRNGYISGFTAAGISLTGNSSQWVIRDMVIQSNGSIAIAASASGFIRILTSSITTNQGAGISCGSNCHIQDSIVSANGGGVNCADSCHVEGNNISNNGSSGVNILSGTVLGNTILSNDFEGVIDGPEEGDVGFGNNTIVGNNGGGDQVSGATPLRPNYCVPSPC